MITRIVHISGKVMRCRAYKTRTVRWFDKELAAGNPEADTYHKLDTGPEHIILLSIPLLDPMSGFPLAVLNIGTFSIAQADLMRALKKDDLMSVVEAMRQQPLDRLMQAAGLQSR